MSYGRIDVNLLPPELQPGPAVRYAVILNALIIACTLAYIGLDSAYSLLMLGYARADHTALVDQVEKSKVILGDYDKLVEIRDQLQRYGRLVSLASADYVDVPVLLDRLSRILPDGVYIDRVANEKDASSAERTVIIFGLRSSRRDPQQVLDTLRAFKGDPLFAECYMPTLDYEELPLAELMQRNQVSWSVAGPDVPTSITAQQFTFEIRASVPRKLENLGLPKSSDDSAFFAGFKLLPPPPPTTGTAKSGKGARPPAGKETEAGPPAETAAPSNAPAGVGVAEVH